MSIAPENESPPVVSEAIPPAFQAPDILELIRRGSHFTERRGGVVHVVEAATGNSLVMLDNIHKIPTHFVRYENPDGTFTWAEEGAAKAYRPEPYVTYSPLIVDEICRQLVEGIADGQGGFKHAGLTHICGQRGMPTYNEFCRWRRAHPWIEEALAAARRDRAERLRDEAIEIADTARDAKDAPAKALRADIRKWSAGVDNEKYNPKTKIEANIAVPTQIIVHTGIPRNPPPPIDVTPAIPEGENRE